RLLGLQPRALDGGADRDRAELVSGQARKLAHHGADRRAGGGYDDDGVVHAEISLQNGWTRKARRRPIPLWYSGAERRALSGRRVVRHPVAQPQALRIRKDVVELAGEDAALARLPILGLEQLGVVLQERAPDARVAEQERGELLREDVVRADRVPGLGRQLVLGRARRRDAPETAVGEIGDLVVVVEDDAAVPGDAEVLVQHVAGKDVRGNHVLDRVAVLDDRRLELRVVGALEVQVQRHHPALDVQVADQHRIAFLL